MERAIKLASDLSVACKMGGFHPTKWTSNSRKVLESIPGNELSKEITNLDLLNDELPVERALGMEWWDKPINSCSVLPIRINRLHEEVF